MKSPLLALFLGLAFATAVFFLVAAAAAPTAPEKKPIFGGSKPIGPYTPGIDIGNLVFLAGQIGIDPSTGKLVEGGVRPEARQAMENIGRVLAEAGLGYEHVVKATIFLADIGDYPAVNEVYGGFFPEGAPHPARSTVAVAAIPAGARVEIEVIAAR